MTRCLFRSLLTALLLTGAFSTAPLSAQESTGSGGSQNGVTAADPTTSPGTPAGGGAVADFTSLMTLIETTVSPQTWDSVGGNSTMEPYTGGVRIDADAALSEKAATSAQLAKLRQTLQDPGTNSVAADWRAAARIRVVSLSRLGRVLQSKLDAGQPPDEAMLHLAGLSRIRCLIWNPDTNEVLIAGTVGGFIDDSEHGLRDARSGAPTIHLTDFAAALAAGINGSTFGCSIDPTPAGIAGAQQVAAKGLPAKQLAAELTAAMGFHNVTVFGVPSDSPIGVTLVAADLHVKQLVLGELAGPPEFQDYFSVVRSTIAEGPPGGELLRFWFAPRKVDMRTDASEQIYSWSEMPMRLLSEREMADAMGRRRVVGDDARANVVANAFTTHLESLCRQYPIYYRLNAVFEAAMCGALLRREAGGERAGEVLGLIAAPETWLPSVTNPPGRVVPLVAQRSIRHGRTQHHVTVISGGVRIAADEALPSKEETRVYPTLSSLSRGVQGESQTLEPDRWWWNAN